MNIGNTISAGVLARTSESPVSPLEYHAIRTPEKTALRDVEGFYRQSYRGFRDRVRRAANLLTRFGVQAGDRIAVLTHNDPRVFEVLYAAAYLDAIMVPMNWRLTATEVSHLFDDCEPSVLLFDNYTEALAMSSLTDHPEIKTIQWSDSETSQYEEALAAESDELDTFDYPSSDPWVIIYTSGTTGEPKGVVHSRRSVMANIENSAYAGEISSSSTQLTILPTFHVAGLHLYANPTLFRGGTGIIMRSFDPKKTLEIFSDKTLGLTHCCGVPANFQFISQLENFEEVELVAFNATVGGSPVPRSVVELWRSRGVDMMPIYGVSEGGSSVLAMPPRGSESKTAVGLPVINAHASIRGPEGQKMDAGEIGELWIKGAMLMTEYWRKPDKTLEAVDSDGWFHTGDAALIDTDGIVHIVDRWKDMYISGGENVYPAEIENVLYQHPGIAMASVVGVEHEKWGEVGCAFIVPKEEALDENGLRAWCLDKLAKYKMPLYFRFVEALPQNATGKILKTELRKWFG